MYALGNLCLWVFKHLFAGMVFTMFAGWVMLTPAGATP